MRAYRFDVNSWRVHRPPVLIGGGPAIVGQATLASLGAPCRSVFAWPALVGPEEVASFRATQVRGSIVRTVVNIALIPARESMAVRVVRGSADGLAGWESADRSAYCVTRLTVRTVYPTGSMLGRGAVAMLQVPTAPTAMQRRVQFVVLLQFAEHMTATAATTRAICPGTDKRDFESALGYLLDDGALEGPTWHLSSLVALAEGGALALTKRGQRRLDEDDV